MKRVMHPNSSIITLHSSALKLRLKLLRVLALFLYIFRNDKYLILIFLDEIQTCSIPLSELLKNSGTSQVQIRYSVIFEPLGYITCLYLNC